MSSTEHFSLTTFTNTTKYICTFSAISMFLIMLFIIGPFSKMTLISTLIKIIKVLLLSYTMYLNTLQITYLQNISGVGLSSQVSSQLLVNIICSYVFTLFIGLLIIFVAKSVFQVSRQL